jgi:hypothetical protein
MRFRESREGVREAPRFLTLGSRHSREPQRVEVAGYLVGVSSGNESGLEE